MRKCDLRQADSVIYWYSLCNILFWGTRKWFYWHTLYSCLCKASGKCPLFAACMIQYVKHRLLFKERIVHKWKPY